MPLGLNSTSCGKTTWDVPTHDAPPPPLLLSAMKDEIS